MLVLTHGTIPSELDGQIVIVVQGVTQFAASGRYRGDIDDKNHSREEGSWKDGEVGDDRGEPRSTISFGPMRLEVTLSAEEIEKGNDEADKGEATSDGMQDKGGAQRLGHNVRKVIEFT